MKKTLLIGCLILLPLCLLFTVRHIKQFQGPYFYGTNADPDYVYLINSLNLARLKLPGHLDHPGTPVQVIGGITIRLTHILIGNGKIVDDVLSRPELYLQILNIIFLLLNVLTLFFSGWIVLNATKKIELAILFQLAPFLTTIPEQLLKVSTEPTLVVACLLFSALIIEIYFKEDLLAKKDQYIILLAVISAFGVATKITFAPLILITFVFFKQWKDRLYFVLVFVLSFLIFAFPLIFRWAYFKNWVKGLFLGTGIYGSGKQTIIDPAIVIENFVKIISSEIAFDVLCISTITLWIAFFFYKPLKDFCVKHNLRFKMVGMSLVIYALYLIMISKHYHYRYMIPPAVFSVFSLIVIVSISKELIISPYSRKLVYSFFLTSFLIIIISHQINSLSETKRMLKYHLSGQSELLSFINEKYPSVLKIYSYGSSSIEQALSLALGYAHTEQPIYISAVKSKYPNSIFFNFIDKTFYRWIPTNPINIEKALDGKNEVYLHISSLKNNGLALDGRLPIINPDTNKPTGRFIYVKDLNEGSAYRETIYKLEKIDY